MDNVKLNVFGNQKIDFFIYSIMRFNSVVLNVFSLIFFNVYFIVFSLMEIVIMFKVYVKC